MIRSISRVSLGLTTLFLAGLMIAGQAAVQAQEKKANTKQESGKAKTATITTINLNLKAMYLYEINVVSKDGAVGLVLSSDRPKSRMALNGSNSAAAEGGKTVEWASSIRHMPQAGEGGEYKLEITSTSKKPVTDYTLTMKVQVTR